MPPRSLVDANLILRFLIGDHQEHFERVNRLFDRAANGELVLVVMPWVVAEVVYVMRSVYGGTNAHVAALLSEFFESTNVQVVDRAWLVDALGRFAENNIDFVDCLLAAQGAGESISVASFDRDLDRFADVERLEP